MCVVTEIHHPSLQLLKNSEQRGSVRARQHCAGGRGGAGVGYLAETVRLRGAQRLVGQLQQLLRTLQGFGTGAQLTLRKSPNPQSKLECNPAHFLYVLV